MSVVTMHMFESTAYIVLVGIALGVFVAIVDNLLDSNQDQSSQ